MQGYNTNLPFESGVFRGSFFHWHSESLVKAKIADNPKMYVKTLIKDGEYNLLFRNLRCGRVVCIATDSLRQFDRS